MTNANALGVKYQAADIARGYGANHVWKIASKDSRIRQIF
jgi:hypothetical protein